MGWDLVGAKQGGWQILVIRGTAGYDGMCRPRHCQDFVFVGGVFAGTLSSQAMDSRPSRITTVVFDIANGPPVVQPVSTSTANH